MKKILIIYAHPTQTRSKINRALIEAVVGLENVTISNLYYNYPDFLIDVEKEQRLCEEHDIIIFQHPFYWYSAPAILKEWQDLVLQHGWAYGSSAEGLKGKLFLQTITAGGDDSTYQRKGYNEFTINELTSPFKAMSKLCKMEWLPPFAILGIHRGLPENQIRGYAEEYRRAIVALREDKIDFKRLRKSRYLNEDLNSVIVDI